MPPSDAEPAAPHADVVDTIVAIATPPGRGGIGIVRLSGPLALTCAARLCTLRTSLEPNRARLVDILDPAGDRIDQGVITYYRAPRSYTGDDVVEIAAHGAPVVLEMLVRTSIQAGARLAEPGEFTARSFLSGRIDLTQAEAVRDLIEADTLYQARVAAQQLGGALSRRVQPIKYALVQLIATLEAGIDFAEDDTPVLPRAELVTAIVTITSSLSTLEKSFAHGRLVHSGLTLAIIGRPNVGKSSLFNRLLQQERAIVTAAPGTTRDLVSERAAFNGIPVQLVDTAGLRTAADEAERIGIARSHQALADADIVLIVTDGTTGLTAQDEDLLATLENRRAILVANKADLPPAATIAGAIRTSALTGEGIDVLREKIGELLQIPSTAGEGGMLTNLRHHLAITNALSATAAARTAAESGTPDEMLLLDLYTALRELDALTGTTTPDDILHLIFSTFCIGK